MVAFTYRMPAGIPGDVNRTWAAVVEPQIITPSGTTGAPTAYGVPLVIDAAVGNVGNMRAVAGTDAAANVYGILVRPYPTVSSQDGLGTSTPPASGPCDVLRSGYMTVLLSGSAAATKGGAVWIWTDTASGTHIVGGYEATSSSTSTIALTNGIFVGPADTSGNVEISYNV